MRPASPPRRPGLRFPLPPSPFPAASSALEIKWSKAPCRFCGTGCGVMVGVKEGQVVATHGDMQAEVNRGLNCVKGYFLSKIMYGADRLTTPLLRKRNGVFDKDGEFEPVSWDEAFDVMAEQCKQVLKEKGPTAVGMFGSGQWTIFEGYAATKLMRAGFRSNNLDPNARHCMASAAYAFMRTFGMDEPMGCYDDFEHADAFVLWGSNMAEMHPILWTRLADRRLGHPHVKVAVLSTFTHRSMDLADIPIIFKPGTDLAILNYIANHIITDGPRQRGRSSTTTPTSCAARPTSATACGPDDPLRDSAAKGAADRRQDGADRLRGLQGARLGLHAGEGGRSSPASSRSFLEELAELYADPSRKVMSLWTMGFNQHVRGVWANQMVYNIHLLTGKISEPGNSPFSLTGQPSACGTAREVGTFAHRLPADMVVTNPEHRKHAEEIWKLPHGLLPEKPGYHAVAAGPHAEGRQAQFLLGAGQQQPPGRAQHQQRDLSRLPQSRQLHRRVRRLSDRHGDGRRPRSCRPRCGSRRKAPTATPSAAPMSGTSWCRRRARRAPTSGSSSSSPSASPPTRSGRRRSSTPIPDYRGKTLFDVLFRNGNVDRFPLSEIDPDYDNNEAEGFRLLHPEGAVRGIRRASAAATATTLRPTTATTRCAACAGRWSTARRRAGATARGYDPYVKPGEGVRFYGQPDGRAVILAVPYEPPAEVARRGVRSLAGDRPRAGALAFRLDDDARAGALQGLSRRALLHECRRRPQARHQPGGRGAHRLAARRDPLARRDARPQPHAAAAWSSCRGSTRASSSTRSRSTPPIPSPSRRISRNARSRSFRSPDDAAAARRACSPAAPAVCAGPRRIAQMRRSALTGPTPPMETVAAPNPCRNGSPTTSAGCGPIRSSRRSSRIRSRATSFRSTPTAACPATSASSPQGSGAPMISVTHYMTATARCSPTSRRGATSAPPATCRRPTSRPLVENRSRT